MFDLVTHGQQGRPLREAAPGSTVTSIVVHAIVVTLVLVVPLLRITHALPPPVAVGAFVASAPAPPPPPPPAYGAPKPVQQTAAREVVPANPEAAPIAAPAEIAPEPAAAAGKGSDDSGAVEGGVEGGVAGGIAGGSPESAAPPPPPPPPPPAPRGPVRIGGAITAPALVKRVEPIYPDFAAQAKLTGLVILEATVGLDGHVEAVTVLRSAHRVLDGLAVNALKQWEYSPLVINGSKSAFTLTVTFNFSVARK